MHELIDREEPGETIVVQYPRKPVFQMMPTLKIWLNVQAGKRWLRARAITDPVPFIAADFDAALPEDFLIAPIAAQPKRVQATKPKAKPQARPAAKKPRRITPPKR